VYDDQGQLIQKGAYKNGKEDGEWTFYAPGGSIRYVGMYSKGEPVGTWFIFVKGRKKVYKRY
jgi:antitoxin component YwqK of YwqJK toxin-antitoxin module